MDPSNREVLFRNITTKLESKNIQDLGRGRDGYND
jgi:hypothetical protein